MNETNGCEVIDRGRWNEPKSGKIEIESTHVNRRHM